MWSFLWRPGWLLTHLLVAVAVVVMVALGFWQLERWQERRAQNALVEQREELAPADVAEVFPWGPGPNPAQAAEAAYRRVTVAGAYAPSEQVLVRNRSFDGAPGYWVVTPLVTEDGWAIAVNRGWVPFASTDPDGAGWDAFAPPPGRVEVAGLLRDADVAEGAVLDASAGRQGDRVTTLPRVELADLARQVRAPLLPVYLDLREQDPAQPTAAPLPVPAPELSEGPHLGYAGQWFIFAALTVVVYAVMLRRASRGKARSAPDPASVPSAVQGGQP